MSRARTSGRLSLDSRGFCACMMGLVIMCSACGSTSGLSKESDSLAALVGHRMGNREAKASTRAKDLEDLAQTAEGLEQVEVLDTNGDMSSGSIRVRITVSESSSFGSSGPVVRCYRFDIHGSVDVQPHNISCP